MTCSAASLLGGVTPIIPMILTGMPILTIAGQVRAPAKQGVNRSLAATLDMRGMAQSVRSSAELAPRINRLARI